MNFIFMMVTTIMKDLNLLNCFKDSENFPLAVNYKIMPSTIGLTKNLKNTFQYYPLYLY